MNEPKHTLSQDELNMFAYPIKEGEFEQIVEVISKRTQSMFTDGRVSLGLVEVLWNTAVYFMSEAGVLKEGADLEGIIHDYVQIVGPITMKAVGRKNNEPGRN